MTAVRGQTKVPTSEGTSQASAQRAGSRLPESALAGLQDAFAGEIAERLPRLRAAAETLDPELLREALRDVHTLGSSAYVVGEDGVAQIARAAEAALVEQRPLAEFAGLVRTLDAQLGSWLR